MIRAVNNIRTCRLWARYLWICLRSSFRRRRWGQGSSFFQDHWIGSSKLQWIYHVQTFPVVDFVCKRYVRTETRSEIRINFIVQWFTCAWRSTKLFTVTFGKEIGSDLSASFSMFDSRLEQTVLLRPSQAPSTSPSTRSNGPNGPGLFPNPSPSESYYLIFESDQITSRLDINQINKTSPKLACEPSLRFDAKPPTFNVVLLRVPLGTRTYMREFLLSIRTLAGIFRDLSVLLTTFWATKLSQY